jgi:hypothetical protein
VDDGMNFGMLGNNGISPQLVVMVVRKQAERKQ